MQPSCIKSNELNENHKLSCYFFSISQEEEEEIKLEINVLKKVSSKVLLKLD